MAKSQRPAAAAAPPPPARGRPSALLDTRVIYCGDNLEQLNKLPDRCADLVYIDPPFNSNCNYEVFGGETKEKRAFKDRHASTQVYYIPPRYGIGHVRTFHVDWHAVSQRRTLLKADEV